MDTKNKSNSDFRRKSAAPGLASPGSEELVASSPSQRNWRGIGIALLVILAVCSLIVIAVVLLTPGDSGLGVKGERFQFDDFLEHNFTTSQFNGTWVSGSEFLYRSKTGDLLLYDAEIQNTTVMVPSEPFRERNPELWYLSPDRKYMLFVRDIQKIFRHSFRAVYMIHDIALGTDMPLGPDTTPGFPLQYAAWGPVGNNLVFVFENNVYYKPSALSNATKLTGSRMEDAVYNGVPDWIYEEEILSSNSALWFSKDGSYLCVASFNDSLVPVQPFEWYGNEKDPFLYPKPDLVKYPKPGTTNPTVQLLILNISSSLPDVVFESIVTPPFSLLEEAVVSLSTATTNYIEVSDNLVISPGQNNPLVTLWVADVTNRRPKAVNLKPPEIITKQDYYFTSVTWASNTDLSVIWMNRRQNLSIVSICSPPQWFCNESYREETSRAGWVDLYDPPLFSSDGSHYFLRGAVNDLDAGLFRQVVLQSVHERNREVLTMTKSEVTKINAYDEQDKLIYYTVAPHDDPGQRQLYRISAAGSAAVDSGVCLTCDLGPECLYVSATFSTNARYYVLDCLGPEVPKQYLYESRSNKQLAVLETNAHVEESLKTKAVPAVLNKRIPLDDGYDANVRLLLPPELNKNEITTYPMIVNVYGGPGSQQVNEKFNVDWGTYLTSNKSYIYAMIDGRGSGFQGEKRKFELYRRLGTVEVEDQIAVTKHLIMTLPFIDKRKVAIWGWSYGGYVTAKIMATDLDVFKCGISVAPVTRWNFYDSVYTERYMGFPNDDNGKGYAAADVLTSAANFRNKEFFLIHGTADDNVHVQQSMLLASALAHEEILFREQIYPDENHALYSVQKHLYLSMTDFLEDCFVDNKISEVGPQALDSNKDDGEGE